MRYSYIIVCLFLCSCVSESINKSTGSIRGTVVDNDSMLPISNALVKIEPGGNSFVTGSDGAFEFSLLELGEYVLSVSCNGYKVQKYDIVINNESVSDYVIRLSKSNQGLTIDKELLDFGSNYSLTQLAFSFVNASYEDMDWTVVSDDSVRWLKKVATSDGRSSGVLDSFATEILIVEIDRAKLPIGENTAKVKVVSGCGTAEVVVSAVGVSREPEVWMDSYTFTGANSLQFSAQVISEGVPKYFERGFIYDTVSVNAGSAQNGVWVPLDYSDVADFSADIKGLNYDRQYFVKAYAKNSDGVFLSENELCFKTKELDTVCVEVLEPECIDFGQYYNLKCRGQAKGCDWSKCLEKGFLLSTEAIPTLNSYDNIIVSDDIPGDDDIFSAKTYIFVDGRDLDCTIRAYVKYHDYVSYSEPYIVHPNMNPPKLEMTSVEVVPYVSVLFYAKLTSRGIPACTDYGFVISETSPPTCSDIVISRYMYSTGLPVEFYGRAFLTDNTRYFVRPYAIQSGKAYYGNQMEFGTYYE